MQQPPEGEEQPLDWSLLPGSCRQHVIQCMGTVSRAAWRCVDRQARQDVSAWTQRLTWKGRDEAHLVRVPVSGSGDPEPAVPPATLLAALPHLKHLVCKSMPLLSSVHGVPAHLRSLDLTQCSGMQDLSAMQHCTTLSQLVLVGLYQHWQHVVRTFTPLTPALGHSLRRLTIKQTRCAGEAAEMQGELLRSLAYLTSLQQLTLWLPKGEDCLWHAFAPLLAQMTGLQALDLSGNYIGIAVPSIASATAQLPQLHTVQLAYCDLDNEGSVAVGQALWALSPGLTQLDLSWNEPNADGLKVLSPALQTHAATLTTLQLTGMRLGCTGSAALAPALSCCSALTSLALAENVLGAKGAAHLAEPLLAIAGSVSSLDLSDNQLAEEGAAALAPSLAAMTALTRLDIRVNPLGRAGAEALAPALQSMIRLEYLNLALTSLGIEGLASLIPAIQALPQIRYWDVANNDLDDEGAKILAAALPTLTPLALLVVSGHEFEQGIELLRQAAEHIWVSIV